MVMYEDDNKGVLALRYSYTPSASEVVKDIIDAPIERGETFQNRRKGSKATVDKYVAIVAEGLGDKAKKCIVSDMQDYGWEESPVIVGKGKYLGFKIPEEAEREEY